MLASRRSDPEGRFSFAASDAAGVTGVVARRIGYGPIAVQLSDTRNALVIEMEEIAVPLPTVFSTAVESICPNKEDRNARDIWNGVRRRYFPLPYRYGMAYAVTIDSSMVRPEDIGKVDDARQFAYAQSIGAGQRLADSARITQLGYAFEYKVSAVRPTTFHKVDRRWKYLKLQSYMTQHFLDAIFGDRHTFSIVSRKDAETVIGFCPRKSDPSISGTLVVRSDMTLISATWRFHTEPPNDDAGGEVVFVPPARWSRTPLLLPAESTSWQRTQGPYRDHYRQEVARYQRWNAQDTMAAVWLSRTPRDSLQ
jgi:hypothetical protein